MTLQNLENAIDKVVNVLRTVSPFNASNQVPLNPPETMSYTTFALVYPFSGNTATAPTGTRRGLHNIAIDVLDKRIDLARSLERLKPLVDTVPHRLIREISYDSDGNPGSQFSGSIETFANLSYNWIQSTYAGVDVVGYHFLMEDVKILVNL